MPKDDIRRRLARSAMTFGDFGEWRRACEDAKAAGITQSEVDHILFVYHPSTWLFGGIILVVAIAVVCSVV